jgi:hypothetical protein
MQAFKRIQTKLALALAACCFVLLVQQGESAYLRNGGAAHIDPRALITKQRQPRALSTTYYANEICVENAGTFNLKFGIDGWSDDTAYYGWSSTETKCIKLSDKGTAGDTYEATIKVQDSSKSSNYNVAYYDTEGSVTFKCKGTEDSWSCSCSSGCTTKEPSCADPVMSDVVLSNVVFTETGSTGFSYTCNNTDGEDTLACAASYSWTSEMTQSLTMSSSLTFSEGVTFSLKENFKVADASEGVSFTVSESFSESQTTTTTTSWELDAACSESIPSGDCNTLVAAFVFGEVKADYTATVTCSSGVSSSVSGTMEFDNVYSTASTDSCTSSTCSS